MLENCFQRFPLPLPEKNTTQVLKTCDPITYIETGTSTPVPERLFFNKVAGLTCNFIKKEALGQVFSCEFCEIFKNSFFYRTPLVAASGFKVFPLHFPAQSRNQPPPPPPLKRLRWTTALQQYTFLISN